MTMSQDRTIGETLMDGFFDAMGLFTRMPLPAPSDRPPLGAAACWAWPVVGALIGAVSALIGAMMLSLGLPVQAAALVILATQAMITGALHEDGLADTADGLWGGWDKARRLEIMKDSRIGSYGVIALVLSYGARWTAIVVILSGGGAVGIGVAMIAAGALSRGGLPGIMHYMGTARGDGLSVQTGRPAAQPVIISAAVAVLGAWILLGTGVAAAVLVTLLVLLAMAWIAQNRIGGQTGDILGAMQILVEIAVLFTLL